MVSIQERFLIKSGLWWRAYGIWKICQSVEWSRQFHKNYDLFNCGFFAIWPNCGCVRVKKMHRYILNNFIHRLVGQFFSHQFYLKGNDGCTEAEQAGLKAPVCPVVVWWYYCEKCKFLYLSWGSWFPQVFTRFRCPPPGRRWRRLQAYARVHHQPNTDSKLLPTWNIAYR